MGPRNGAFGAVRHLVVPDAGLPARPARGLARDQYDHLRFRVRRRRNLLDQKDTSNRGLNHGRNPGFSECLPQ